MEEKFFSEDGKLATRKRKQLKDDACLLGFDFSAYKSRLTACPTHQANSDVAVCCRERAQWRISGQKTEGIAIVRATNVKLASLHTGSLHN